MSFVLPSSLFEIRDDTKFDMTSTMDNTLSLKVGIVYKIYDADDPDNISKIYPEYDVLTVNSGNGHGVNTCIYEHCNKMESFGNGADFFQAKLRDTTEKVDERKMLNFQEQKGSIVLILCLDGIAEKAVIIGSLSNTSKKLFTKELGHHMEGEFNGLNWKVNKDGELTVTFKAATKPDGKPVDEEGAKKSAGTFLKINKEGSIEVNVSKKEFFKIDKTKKTIDLNAEKDINVITDAKYNLTSKDATNITCKDLVAKASGKIEFNASAPSAFNIEGALNIKAPQLTIDSSDMVTIKTNKLEMEGSEVTIKGSKVTIDSSMIMLGMGGTPALTSATQFIGIGNLGGSVISTAIGPFSSSVFIGS